MAKRVKVSRKELLREDDQFLSTTQKVMAYLSDHVPLMLTMIGGLIIIFALVTGYRYNQNMKEMRMENLYSQMTKIQNGKDTKKSDNKIVELENIFTQFQEGSQKTRASLLLGEEYYKDQQYDNAIEIYSEIASQSGGAGISHQLAKMGLAQSHEGKKDYTKAVEIYKAIVGNSNGFPLFEVYTGLARCYELSNDKKNALTTLREMENKFSSHPQIDSVKRRIVKLSEQA
jgi:lipopolysaccharide biosynthesis regulator YciM